MHINKFIILLIITLSFGCIAKSARCIETDSTLKISYNKTDLVTFNKSEIAAPEGGNKRNSRSGFIHPLKSLKGVTLTQIHPSDHEHHMGLWHPWTKTTYQGKEVDFWNLYKGEGYVRYTNTLQSNESGFTVVLEHLLKANNKVILTDTFSVTVDKRGDNFYLLDYRSLQTCVADSPIVMQKYRYGGGLGLRLTKAWKASVIEVLTSEGTTRNNTDATCAYWLKLRGTDAQGQTAGMVIVPSATNFSYPEQIRLWDDKMYTDGDFMVNISPTKKESLTMWPGKSYEFNYRLIIFDGDISKAQIETELKRFNPKK